MKNMHFLHEISVNHVSFSFTLGHGAYLPPGGCPALTGVLAQRRLQEEQGDATEEEENKVRDEEDSCKYR